MKLPELSNASSRYGASMGRQDTKGEYDLPQHFYIQKLAWIDGDYDTGGAYWGQSAGEHIYRCFAYDLADGMAIEYFKRAKSYQAAFVQLVDEYELATFETLPDELDEAEPTEKLYYGYAGDISIEMTLEDANSMSHPGQCDSDVSVGRQKAYLARQLAELDTESIRQELTEYGFEDVSDNEQNLDRILWLAACFISEDKDRDEDNESN